MIKERGIVLKLQDYKEKDGLVWLMTPDRILSVRARGIQASTSKLRSGCQPFAYVEWDIEDRKQGIPLLIQIKVLRFFYKGVTDLKVQALSFVLRDILLRTKSTPSVFDVFMAFLQRIDKEKKHLYTAACFVLREILIVEGIHPYVKGCVLCHRKDMIETLSAQEGGFVCHFCNKGQRKSDKESLKKIYALFHASISDLDRLCDLYSFSLEDCLFWVTWYEHYEQIHLKSVTFLKTVSSL